MTRLHESNPDVELVLCGLTGVAALAIYVLIISPLVLLWLKLQMFFPGAAFAFICLVGLVAACASMHFGLVQKDSGGRWHLGVALIAVGCMLTHTSIGALMVFAASKVYALWQSIV